MAKADTSRLMNKLKKKTKGAWSRSRGKEPRAKGSTLPGGIVRGVARLSSYKFAEDKNGNPYFMLTGVVHEPEEFSGQKATTSHFIKDTKTKTVQDKLDDLSSDLQLLGADLDGTTEDDLPSICEQLVESAPFYYFNTWKPEGDGGTFIFIQGLAEDWDEGDADAEVEAEADDAPDDEDPDPEEDGGIDVGDRVAVHDGSEEDGWEGTVTEWSDDGEAYVQADADDEVYGPLPYDQLTALEADGDPEEDADAPDDPDDPEEDAADADGDWTPEEGEVYMYKASPRGKKAEAEVTAVNVKAETVDLRRVSDNKKFPGVSWDKLEGAD